MATDLARISELGTTCSVTVNRSVNSASFNYENATFAVSVDATNATDPDIYYARSILGTSSQNDACFIPSSPYAYQFKSGSAVFTAVATDLTSDGAVLPAVLTIWIKGTNDELITFAMSATVNWE